MVVNMDVNCEVRAEELSGLHSAFLFHPRGWDALKSMCTLLSGTLPSPYISSWKDLAAHLQLTIHQIGCIENGKLDDCTWLVLKTFAQSEDATLDKVVSSLVKMKRSDVITNAWPHLIHLKEFVLENKLQDDEWLREVLEEMKASLPITLSLGGKSLTLKVKSDERETLTLGTASPHPPPSRAKKPRKCSIKVMLTFGPDGRDAAREVEGVLRRRRGHIHPIGVLILEDHYEKVVANPHNFIIDCFGQTDYVIPILTVGYLQSIGGRARGVSREGGCLDATYAQFIHTLMNSHYIRNSCLNKKVRCIIPQDHLNQVTSHPLMEISPVLSVTLPQSETERLARQLLMAKLKIPNVPPPDPSPSM